MKNNKINDGLFDTFISQVINELTKSDIFLTGMQIRKKFEEYSVKYAIEIPHTSRNQKEKMISKSSLFYENIKCFSNEQKFSIIKDFLELPKIENENKFKSLKLQLIQDYRDYNVSNNIEKFSEDIEKVKSWLNDYPKALNAYNDALEKLENKIYERNTLDDLRLCLELFLKQYLNNEKSIENQQSEIGKYLKDKNISNEIRNMFSTVLGYYTKYQNNNVKHNEKYNSNEIYFIFELTTVFLRFLVNLK